MDFFSGLLGGLGLQAKQATKISVEECVQMVQRFLSECGVDPNSSKLKTENCLGWLIQKGSAEIYIVIGNNELINEVTLEVFSPILKLPKQNILPFYRRCLEVNRFLIGCALCVDKDEVMVVSERQLEGLNYEELETMIICVANAADTIDDELAKEFGAQLAGAS